MCDDNEDNFIAKLYNVLLEPDIYDRLFPFIVLMNSGHTCLFNKVFCMVYFGYKETTYCTAETCIFGENKANIKIKENRT